ncbi:aminotransferase class V-fold PLP-dependent enzyme [candidate division KSB1 bacterium]|nr:aminotransferase class V-fold PLP-dependent enzyme [candidate division KSB1 bacterium]
MRSLGHRMVDDMITYLQTLRERPAWQPIPQQVKERLHQPLPQQPEGAEVAYQDFLENVLPYPHGNIHPRYWGFVNGTGTVLGMFAEMLAAAMNPNVGGADHSAVYVERQVLDWCKEMLGYPPEASGILVSGGSMANLLGLAVARNTKTDFDIRTEGVRAAPGMMTVYCSSETHSSVQKAVELLGLGNKALRKVPMDREYRLDSAHLEKMIAEDRQAGYLPFCVVGTAGTVNTGAIDPLNRLADICRREGLWFHVDGAFGSLAALLPEMRDRLSGMARADSLAFDLHKWMYLPYEAGCVLVKSKAAHEKAFAVVPAYLAKHERGLMAGPEWFANYGIQLTRGFRALKAWLVLKEHGLDKFRRLIRQNIAQAQYLASLVEKSESLKLLAPVPLNVVCFRFTSARLDEKALNELNRELLMELHERGIAVPTSTVLQGKYALRVAITNHRSRKEDFETLVREAERLGKECLQ